MNIRFTSLPSQLDVGPTSESIVVAVNGGSSGWQALDWATAEAAARGAPLRIVHVIAPPIVLLDPFGSAGPVWIDPSAWPVGAHVLDEAVQRAHSVAPDVPVDTYLECGNLASTIRDSSRDIALTVVGRGHPRRFGRPSPGWRIACRAIGPVAIVELDDQRRNGPSAGRVVLGIDGTAGPAPAVAYAFQAAARRGVGLTVLHAYMPGMRPFEPKGDSGRSIDDLRRMVAIEDALQIYRDAYPDVDVRRRFVPGSAGAALVAESEAAALLVIGARRRRRRHRAPLGSVAQTALRLAHSPVAIVRASTLNDRVAGI